MSEAGMKRRCAEISRSDLAAEFADGGEGTEYAERMTVTPEGEHLRTERLIIRTEGAAARLGRSRGEYLTVTCPPVSGLSAGCAGALTALLADELRRMAERLAGPGSRTVLVAGIGNRALTADAVGPLAADRVDATAHLELLMPEAFAGSGLRRVYVTAPGVTGQTGFETARLLRGLRELCGAELTVAMDALAAGNCDRLGTTFQISTAGISPGAGVGNCRSGITLESIGVPVIAVGVPTVVSSAVIVEKALAEAGYTGLSDAHPLKMALEKQRGFFVSPGDADLMVRRSAEIIGDAVRTAFTEPEKSAGSTRSGTAG